MSVVKIIELVGRSEKSWEDEVQEALQEASKTIETLVGKSIEVRLENVILQNLRDTLLPKLMSGELSLNATDFEEVET